MFNNEREIKKRFDREKQIHNEYTDNCARVERLEKEEADLTDAFSHHPQGRNALHPGSGHEAERHAELAQHGEQAFIFISTVCGLYFTYVSTEIPLPWFLTLILLAAFWAVISYYLARGLRTGVVWSLNVRSENSASEKRVRWFAALLIVLFVVLIVRYSIVRFTAADNDAETVGFLQVALETTALLIAATAGAIYFYWSSIPDLVKRIDRNREEQQKLNARNKQLEAEKRSLDLEVQQLQSGAPIKQDTLPNPFDAADTGEKASLHKAQENGHGNRALTEQSVTPITAGSIEDDNINPAT